MKPKTRKFDAAALLATADELSVPQVRAAINTAMDFGRKDVALALQAKLELRTGLRLSRTVKENSTTNAWLAAGVTRVRNIQYSWSAIAENGIPVFTIWSQELPPEQHLLWSPATVSDAKGYEDRKRHAQIALSKGGLARAFEIRGKRRGHELKDGTSSHVEWASSESFPARAESRGSELWLVWGGRL